MNQEVRPRVFISYSWTSEKHKDWVLQLAERLRTHTGVDVILDRWHLEPGQDRLHFMEKNIAQADKVLIVCDYGYCDKADDRAGGVGTETQIITPEVYNNTVQTKFIPIALEKDSNGYILPSFLKSRFAIWMGDDESIESSYRDLEHAVWGYSLITPPALGDVPAFTLGEGVTVDSNRMLQDDPVGYLNNKIILEYKGETRSKDRFVVRYDGRKVGRIDGPNAKTIWFKLWNKSDFELKINSIIMENVVTSHFSDEHWEPLPARGFSEDNILHELLYKYRHVDNTILAPNRYLNIVYDFPLLRIEIAKKIMNFRYLLHVDLTIPSKSLDYKCQDITREITKEFYFEPEYIDPEVDGT